MHIKHRNQDINHYSCHIDLSHGTYRDKKAKKFYDKTVHS